MMQAQTIPIQNSFENEKIIEESKLNDYKVEKKPFKKFTFNDSDLYRKSTDQLWNEIYQYPADMSFFKKETNCETDHTNPQRDCTQTAMQAWSVFDPEKQPIHEFPVFRSCKVPEEEKRDEEMEPFPKKRGWSDLFSQPFWGSSYEKPPPFMGAFDHVQPDFGNSLNISIPSISQYNPYSRYLQGPKKQIENPYQKSENIQKFDFSRLLDSKLLDSKQINERGQKIPENRYYFEIQSVQSKQKKEVEFEDLKQSKIEEKGDLLDHSLVWNYQMLFGERKNLKYADPAWEAPQQLSGNSLKRSEVFQISKQTNNEVLKYLESKINLAVDIQTILPDHFILSQISKMLQNVECELFTLDYDTLTWKLDLLSFRPELFLRDSLGPILSKILQMASQRSRLSAVLVFLRKNKYRKVYSELNVQISQFLILFEEIILDLARECTLAEFLQKSDKLFSQLKLLYSLLINAEYIQEQQKIYQDIDFRFLHSEALIFKRITKLARNSDGVSLDTNPMVIKLLKAAFRPLLTLLQNLLFEECDYLELNTDLYLRYYFSNPKELLQTLGKKLSLIKQESNELYLICKVKQNFELFHTIKSLSNYEKQWEKSFKRKTKLIQRIRKQHKQKIRWQREKKIEQKMREIFELKSKIYKRQQLQYNLKQDFRAKNRLELEKLKKQLQERKEKRKLMEQIERQREKSILLDLELKEKQKLAKQKKKLIEKMEAESGEVLKSNVQQGEQPKIIEQKEGENQIQLKSKLSIESQREKSKEENDKSLQNHQNSEQCMQEKEFKQPFSELIEQKIPDQFEQLESEKILSENALVSHQSIESIERKYMETAQVFHSIKNRVKHDKKKSSYFRIVNKKETSKLEVQPASSDESIKIQRSQLSESSDEDENKMELQSNEDEKELIVDLQTSLQICVDQIVRKQTEVIENCLSFIIIDKYEILQVIEFLRKTFMSGNGQKVQEFIRLSIGQGSMVELRHFNKCLLFDTNLQQIQKLTPAFYHSKINSRYEEINIFQDNLEYYIGFEFQSLPKILEPYFSYIHLSKYMQIFGFIVRVRHCQNLISDSWKLLNQYKKDLDHKMQEGERVEYELKFMNRLCIVRHKISNFLKIFQNYLFFRVIEKQFKNFRTHLSELNDLSQNHLKMLDNIIKYGFIDNPNQNISKIFKQILSYVNQFYNIVSHLTLDDIPSYSWQQIQKKVKFINETFDNQLRDIDGLLFKLN